MVEHTSSLDRLVLAIGGLAAWLFLAGIVFGSHEVVMRYAFNAPSTWIHETTSTLCAVAFALGGAWCMVRDEHVRITFLLDRLQGRPRFAAEVGALLTGVVYLAGFGVAAAKQAIDALWRFDFRGAWSPELTPGPPHWPLPAITKAALALGTFLFLLTVLQSLVRLVRRRGQP